LGIPYVTYCHGEEITQTAMRKYQPLARNAIYREAKAVVAANEFARQQLLGIGVAEDRIWKIHPGVDAERFRPSPRDPELTAKYGLSGKQVLLTVGRLVPRKGHLAVMEAMARLLPDLPDTVYLIVGKGPEQQRLQQAAERLGISHAVHFAGYVPEDLLADYYNLADIFVMPTAFEQTTGDVEGFGMVFLEANACGKPVVAGRSGGTFDSVSDGMTGFLVEPEDVEELRTVLSGLLKDSSLRQRLGQVGCQRVRDLFDWRRSASQLDALHAGFRCDAEVRHALR
jgi:phosphatidylinositol alpha-1,6-mannosyltransferase